MFSELSNAHLRIELGRRLQTTRVARSVTQADLARRAGISRPTLSALERGHEVSLSTFLAVLRALGLTEGLALVIPAPLPSPIEALEQAASATSTRQRVRPKSGAGADESPATTDSFDHAGSESSWRWGDGSGVGP